MSKNKKSTSSIYVLLIGTAVVLFWRGAWGMIDMFLFPNNEFLSYLTSLIAGIVILIITHKLVDELT